MSATLDANILVYASNDADPLHEVAAALVARLVAGPQILYLFWPTLLGYVRLVTHPAILPRPLPAEQALHNVEQLLAPAHVRTPGEQDGFWAHFRSVAGDDTCGNQVPDAHIAALMRQHGVQVLYTHDRDFRRYDDVEPRDPFA